MNTCQKTTSILPKRYRAIIGAFVGIAFFILLPQTVLAQAFVPVQDIRLNPAFSTFSSNFNKYAADMNSALTKAPDSLRDIIAGPNPQGVAAQECITKNAENKAYAYNDPLAPWAMAYSSSSGQLPSRIPFDTIDPPGSAQPLWVQVNGSASLRCLLQEIVGQNKLALSLQIHALLKQYISDAQQKQLSNQLLNQLNAANLNWAKNGIQINESGIVTTESSYITNYNDSKYNRTRRTVSNMVNRAAAPAGDPVGSLELCDPLPIASTLAKNMRYAAEDPYDYVDSTTRCTLQNSDGGPFPTNADVEEFYQDPNTSKGPGVLYGFGFLLQNPQNTNSAQTIVDEQTASRVEEYKEDFRDQRIGNGGFQGTEVCTDPDCTPQNVITVSPANLSERMISGAIQDNKEQILTTDNLDETVSNASRNAIVDTSSGPNGLFGFDPSGMQHSKVAANELAKEFFNIIGAGYFDLDGEQKNWAWATMLMIYDELSFSISAPDTAVPTGAGDATPQLVPI